MARLGIAFSGGPNPAEIVECVKLAESLGYESAWVAEGHGGDQVAVLAACGEIADGVILTRSTLRTAAAVRERLAEGATRAGRDPARVALTTLLPTAVGETRREALDVLRPGLAFYAGFFPRYNRMMAEQ